MNELNHGPGKGDKERSPGWRRNYDEIDFHRSTRDGFARRGNRLVKAYGGRVAKFVYSERSSPVLCRAENPITGNICTEIKGHEGDHIATRLDGSAACFRAAAPTPAPAPIEPRQLVKAKEIWRGNPGFFEYGSPNCLEVCSGYTCTREEGHTGDHAAHVSPDHQVAAWPQHTPAAELSRYMLEHDIKL